MGTQASGDKTPYKTHQGGFVPSAPSCGWYVEVAAPGVRVGSGFYAAGSAQLASFRAAVADDRTGPELEAILERLRGAGWELGGGRLRTSPRGYAATHPRIELLRHRSMTVGRSYGFEPVIHTPELLDRVRADWRMTRPFLEWVTRHAG